MTIACPHCASAAQAITAFCTACGKALPSPDRKAPRVLKSREFAQTVPGRALQADLLDKESRSAGRTMVWLGAVQTVMGIGIFAAAGLARHSAHPRPAAMIWGLSTVVVGTVFLGLAFWGRRSPLAATFTAFIIYLTLTGFDLFSMTSLPDGDLASGVGAAIGVRLTILALLGRAVTSGIRHRALVRAFQPQP